jgi:hypothetical protein
VPALVLLVGAPEAWDCPLGSDVTAATAIPVANRTAVVVATAMTVRVLVRTVSSSVGQG